MMIEVEEKHTGWIVGKIDMQIERFWKLLRLERNRVYYADIPVIHHSLARHALIDSQISSCLEIAFSPHYLLIVLTHPHPCACRQPETKSTATLCLSCAHTLLSALVVVLSFFSSIFLCFYFPPFFVSFFSLALSLSTVRSNKQQH